ncbi:hypothetical protein [Devosia sp. CAU 1758]
MSASEDIANGVASAKTPHPSQTMVAISLIAIAFACFHALISIGDVLQRPGAGQFTVLSAIMIIGARWQRKDLPFSAQAILLVINVDCVVYLAGAWPTYQLGFDNPAADSVWVPVAFGILALFRPAFLLVPAIAMQWSKVHLAREFGSGVSSSADYIIIPDLAILTVLFMAVLSIHAVVSAKIPEQHRWKFPSLDRDFYFVSCVVALAGVHFSNYFYSGLEKLILPGASPLTWVLENPTYFLAIHTADFGLMTLPNVLGSGSNILPYVTMLNVPINIAVLISQLLVVLVLFSMRASTAVTVFYDLMHLAIFALSAIFFWKWIILNAGFVLAFDSIRRSRIVLPRAVSLLGCAIVVGAPFVSFSIAKLAWFDTPGVVEVRIEAVTDEGTRVTVPSNFYLDGSLIIARQKFAGAMPGFLPTGTWGTTSDAGVFDAMMTQCVQSAQPWELSDNYRKLVSTLIGKYHDLAITLSQDGSGRFSYDFYPHHIWSAPWMFGAFANLDLRTVQLYELVIDARCVSVSAQGDVSRIPVGTARYRFPIGTE